MNTSQVPDVSRVLVILPDEIPIFMKDYGRNVDHMFSSEKRDCFFKSAVETVPSFFTHGVTHWTELRYAPAAVADSGSTQSWQLRREDGLDSLLGVVYHEYIYTLSATSTPLESQ